ncbi:hypothetical protein [Bradyrhizobium sp. HKCCYLS3013]|uniref:hypothetical protein n=1 Tax=Bradyrhizobium sp. HKCCYLS3013 TaxID=3420735 RepID=UPI003EBF569C
MGWNDRLPDLEGEAIAVAVEANAVKPCDLHEDVLINQCDPEADRAAYAMGTNRWKKGDLGCEQSDFMEAIKDVIDQSADECPRCAKIRED